MASVMVDTTKAGGQQDSLLNYQKIITQIEEEIGNIRGSLSFDLQNRAQIVRSMSIVENALQRNSTSMGSMESVLEEAMTQYQSTEEKIRERSGKLTKSEITDAESSTGHSSGGLGDLGGRSNEEDEYDILELLKAYLTLQDKSGQDSNASIEKALVDYYQKLVDMSSDEDSFLAGLSNWYSLGESSSKLWNALYKYLKGNNESLEELWGSKAAAVGVLGSLFGLYSGFADTADTLLAEDSTFAEQVASLVDAGSGAIDVFKSVYEYKNWKDKTSGLYSEAGLWATFAETITSSVSQAYKSIGLYASDGSWDLGDTGATGAEVAIAGLSALISGVTFGIISPKTFGTTEEEISAGIENWANSIGEKAGNYIASDPERYEQYQNGNVFTRIGLTIIGAFS